MNDPPPFDPRLPYTTQPPPFDPTLPFSTSPGQSSDETGLQELNRRAGNLATGVNTALGAPVDAMTWLVNKAAQYARAPDAPPLISKPFLGSEWIKDQVGRTAPKDAFDQLLQATGEGIGSAATSFGIGGALQAAGRAPTVAKTLMGGGTDSRSIASTLTAGAGSGAGGELGDWAGAAVSDNDPTARSIGRLVGGFGGALPGAAMNIRSPLAPPSVAELDASGRAGFREARRFGPDIESSAVTDRARALLGGEFGTDFPEGSIPLVEKRLSAMLDPKRSWTPTSDLISQRNAMSKLARTNPTDEGAAAARVRDEIDDFLSTLDQTRTRPAQVANPMSATEVGTVVGDARRNLGAAMRSDRLTGGLPGKKAEDSLLEVAESRESGLDRALKNEARSMLKSESQLGGFADDELAALRRVRDRDPLRWAASRVGDLLGGRGQVGTGISALTGYGAGTALGLPWWLGPILSPAIGKTSQAVADALARRALSSADRMVRARSPLFELMQAGQPATELMPGLTGRQAIARALVPGLLEPRTRLEIDEGAR